MWGREADDTAEGLESGRHNSMPIRVIQDKYVCAIVSDGSAERPVCVSAGRAFARVFTKPHSRIHRSPSHKMYWYLKEIMILIMY